MMLINSNKKIVAGRCMYKPGKFEGLFNVAVIISLNNLINTQVSTNG